MNKYKLIISYFMVIVCCVANSKHNLETNYNNELSNMKTNVLFVKDTMVQNRIMRSIGNYYEIKKTRYRIGIKPILMRGNYYYVNLYRENNSEAFCDSLAKACFDTLPEEYKRNNEYMGYIELPAPCTFPEKCLCCGFLVLDTLFNVVKTEIIREK